MKTKTKPQKPYGLRGVIRAEIAEAIAPANYLNQPVIVLDAEP